MNNAILPTNYVETHGIPTFFSHNDSEVKSCKDRIVTGIDSSKKTEDDMRRGISEWKSKRLDNKIFEKLADVREFMGMIPGFEIKLKQQPITSEKIGRHVVDR
jgi:superfamily I DNA/RNA helicase